MTDDWPSGRAAVARDHSLRCESGAAAAAAVEKAERLRRGVSGCVGREVG